MGYEISIHIGGKSQRDSKIRVLNKRSRGIGKRKKPVSRKVNITIPDDGDGPSGILLEQVSLAIQKLITGKRKVLRSRKTAPVPISSKEKEPSDDAELSSIVIPSKSCELDASEIEPLRVVKTTTLPVCAADVNIPRFWIKCRKCTQVFHSKDKLVRHREIHRHGNMDGEQKLRVSSLSASFQKEEEMDLDSSAVVVVTERAGSSQSTTAVSRRSTSMNGLAEQNKWENPEQVNYDGANVSPTTTRESISKKNGNASTPAFGLQCSVCDRDFSSRKDLKVHMSSHNVTKPEKSIHLGRSAGGKKTGSSFNGYSTSEDDAPYDDSDLPTFRKPTLSQCPVCKKSFVSEALLKQHLNSHSGEEKLSAGVPITPSRENKSRSISKYRDSGAKIRGPGVGRSLLIGKRGRRNS